MQPGESVGLVGHNGAGKTTTLKLLAGISRPTRGRARTRGRVASLINLGAGFHRELTGRENVYLNGVILGLTRREVRARFDQIVDFADLASYIDTPVKQYSTGMYARLGFAVAVHVDPDVLLVDEVLSVGDVSFQDKSIRKMLSFRERGCSILFVSHNLSAIEMMCQRAVWLDHGQVRAQGLSSEVVKAYLDDVDDQIVAAAQDGQGDRGAVEQPLTVEAATVCAADGTPATDFEFDAPMIVRLVCLVRAGAEAATLTLSVRGDFGPLISARAMLGEELKVATRGRSTVECRFDRLPLLPGVYRLEVRVEVGGVVTTETLAAFRLITDLSRFGSDSVVGVTKSRGGFLAVGYRWRLNTAEGPAELPGLLLPSPTVGIPG